VLACIWRRLCNAWKEMYRSEKDRFDAREREKINVGKEKRLVRE